MNVVKTGSGSFYLTTTFGKTTYKEPTLKMSFIEKLHRVKELFVHRCE